MNGNNIVALIEVWLENNNIHPDDFGMMFAEELLELMEKDK